MAKFKLFYKDLPIATLFTETYEDAVEEAYVISKGKFTKSYIRQVLLTNDEVQEMDKWKEEFCLARHGGEL